LKIGISVFSLEIISLSLNILNIYTLIVRIFGKQLNAKELIGDPVHFSLEERIFNTISITALIAMGFEVPFNWSIGLHMPAYLCAFGFIFSLLVYYISRVRRNSPLAINLFCLICNVSFGINYFFNSGIYGPNLLLFGLIFLVIVAIIPKENFKIWLPINTVMVLIILLIEYIHPEWVPMAYNSVESKTLDHGITYLVVVLMTYFTISYIRKNYDYERFLVLEQKDAIEEQNTRILKQKEELETLNAEKDKLFSIVSHDIKLPLNLIQSYLEIMATADLDEKERQEVEQQLLQITRDTSDLLVNILTWSKTQMDGAYAELTTLDVQHALEQAMKIEYTLAAKKQIDLRLTVADRSTIMADPDMFQLVFRNIVNNAIKFTPVGGQITVTGQKMKGRYLIRVTDNGVGINEEQKKNLFKLKASATYGTNNERGIGLGLLLCKEFIELQGGDISFESKAGEGSVFSLWFKLSE